MVLATYYELLKEYIGFKTVHDTNQFSTEAEKTINRLSEILARHQFQTKEYDVDGIPVLLATYHQNKNLPTGLIYTNYDLELEEISAEWKNNPFNLYLGKDEVIGRGVAENKGQFIVYLATILELIKEEKLWYNISFLIDGTQHKVGTDLSNFFAQHRTEVQADFCCFSHGSGVNNHPTIEVWQRGGINFDLSFTKETENNSVNPTLEVAKILTKLYNVNNKIAIPYFYYNVEKAQQETEVRRYGTNLEYKTITKSLAKNHTILEPTLDITGIISLPKFEKTKTIPKKAIANLSMKIVNNQNYQEIINGLQQRLKYSIPQHLKTELIIHEAFNPCKYNTQNPFTQKAIALLSGAFKTTIEYKQNPIGIKNAESIQRSICQNIVSIPFAEEDSNIGIANENIKIETVKKAFDFCSAFFSK